MDQSTFDRLPLAQREALQQQLIDQGLYGGSPDGKWGVGTAAAFRQQEQQKAAKEERDRAEALKNRELDIRETEAKGKAAEQIAVAKETERKSKAKEEYNKQATSPLGMATQTAASIGAPAAGTTAGLAFGKGINLAQDAAQARRNATLMAAAEDRVRGLTTRKGAVKGTELAGAMPYENPYLRVASRLAPHVGLGAISMGKGAELLSHTDEDQPFYPRMADRAAGLGYIGAGAGLMKRGIQQAANPGISPDVQALSIINSDQLRRSGMGGTSKSSGRDITPFSQTVPPAAAGPSAAPEAPKALTGPSETKRTHANRLTGAAKAARDAGLDIPEGVDIAKKAGAASFLSEVDWKTADKAARTAVARELGIKPGANFAGRISTAIANMSKRPGSSGLVGPLAAAGIAYEMTPKQAQAATEGETPTSDNSEALTNAAIVGGGTYAGGKLASKLPAIGRLFDPVARVAGKVLGPELALASPEVVGLGERITGGLGIPSFAQRMADRSGASELPERGERGLLGRRDLNAAGLTIPPEVYSSIPEQAEIGRANGGRIAYGPLHHASGGRADALETSVPRGAYVINADTISALGQGNTLAGFKVAQQMFPSKRSGSSARDEHVPVSLSGGEFVISPDQVAAIGNGDPKHGADILDQWMQDTRADYVDTLKSLPGPAR